MRKKLPSRSFSESRMALIARIKKYSKTSNFWKSIEKFALKSRRTLPEVNLDKLNRLTSPNDVVLVPGKVLAGGGALKHPLQISAFYFSKAAIEAITRAGGKVISIEKLQEQNPNGSRVKIIV